MNRHHRRRHRPHHAGGSRAARVFLIGTWWFAGGLRAQRTISVFCALRFEGGSGAARDFFGFEHGASRVSRAQPAIFVGLRMVVRGWVRFC